MATEQKPSSDSGVQIACWLSLYGTLLGALFLLGCAAALFFGLPRSITWSAGAVGIVLLGLGRVADQMLSAKYCEVCDESMLWGTRRKPLSIGETLGLPAIEALHRGAMMGRLKCLSCGHEDGRRDETIHFEP